MNKITISEIESLLGFELSDDCKLRFDKFNLNYEFLDKVERDKNILDCIDKINSQLVAVGEHRKNDWQDGWNENYSNFCESKNLIDLRPKYFGKSDVFRWKQDFIKPFSSTFDYDVTSILVDAIIHNFIDQNIENLYEFGCGTGHNLVRFSHYNKNINLIGLDWAFSSQKIIQKIKEFGFVDKIEGYNFNYYKIDHNYKIKDKSVIFTLGSLEQIGEDYVDIVDYWITQKPSLCINFETDNFILNENNLIDKLSILYSEKRNYLNGYFNYLRKLQSEKIIDIVYEKRLFAGTKFHEGFPVIIWKVL